MEFERTFPSSTASQILGLFTDDKFLQDFADELQIQEHSASIDRNAAGPVVTLHWAFPTDMAPAFVRPLLPSQVRLDWQTVWDTVESSSITGTFKVSCDDPSATFEGTTSLSSVDDGSTRWVLTGPVSAKRKGLVPGSVIAGLLETLFREVLNDQATVTDRWLGILPSGIGDGVPN